MRSNFIFYLLYKKLITWNLFYLFWFLDQPAMHPNYSLLFSSLHWLKSDFGLFELIFFSRNNSNNPTFMIWVNPKKCCEEFIPAEISYQPYSTPLLWQDYIHIHVEDMLEFRIISLNMQNSLLISPGGAFHLLENLN